MPTEITQTFFHPELSRAVAKPVLDHAVPLLEEIRNHGLNVFLRCSSSAEGDQDLAILLPYLHFLEMLDAFMILIDHAAEVPSRLQLRSMFEALLTIQYITEADTSRRAHSYLVADIIGRKKWYLRLDPDTKDGHEFRDALRDDPDCVLMTPRQLPDLADRVQNLDELLTKESYRECLVEYERLSGKKKRAINWFALFAGPANIRQLAVRLKRGGTYEVLYGGWSATGHASDTVERQLVATDAGDPAVRGLRDTTQIVAAVNLAVSLSLDATRCLLRHYRSEELAVYGKWYFREVKPLWDKFEPRRLRPDSSQN